MNASARSGLLRFGAFELDPASGELLKRGVRIRLHDKPYQLLMALLERPGETITRKELQERLWPGDTFVEFENGLNNAVSRLRDALGDSAESPRFIETLPRRGYRFIAPVEQTAADLPAALEIDMPPETAAAAPDSASSTSKPVSWRVVTAGFTAASILLMVVVFIWKREAPAGPVSLAVLPFVAANETEGSEDAYLAFAMTDALIGELSRVGALKVISQTSVMQYKGARKSLPDIARELGVGSVVEGSVVREGGQLRVTVQLIDARTDTHLWTQTYSRDPVTALAHQRTLAREAATLIRTRLVPSDRSTTPMFQQTNPAAYEAYVKGRYFMQRHGEDQWARARAFFEQSIAADPKFAPAHVGLSNYFLATDAVAPAEAMPRAKASALHALALDESNALAHASLAFVHYFGDWDWAVAEREFARAIELDPNDSWTRRWHALYLSSMGRHATAVEEIQRAIELDPVSISAFDAAGAIWSNARGFDHVLEQAKRIHDLSPGDPRGFMHFAIGHLQQDRFAEAVEALQKGLDGSGRHPSFLCILAVAQHRAGQTREAHETLLEIEQLATKGYVPDTFLALAYLWLRDDDAALRQLERAYQRRDGYLVVVNVAPWFDRLRGHPVFQQLLQRMDFRD
jgi:TolB-like protein/DNA-binding winged helix-turn-helix (wHTH) protein/Flp pilus assembly protein TadD